ncbi:hypothetical protein ACET3Z_031536 [Daucus carota]
MALLMSAAEVKGKNRFGSVDTVTPCCGKGGDANPSAESLTTPAPSPSESPLTVPPIVAGSPSVLTYRGGTVQLVVTAGKASP